MSDERKNATRDTISAEVAEILNKAVFTSIYDDWLPTREKQLEQRLRGMKTPQNPTILLVNGTKGRKLYGSIIDYFVTVKKNHPKIKIVSASYFGKEIYEFKKGVKAKGVDVIDPQSLKNWPLEKLNSFYLVIGIGPSEAFNQMIEMQGLTSKLLLIDLAFFHQIIESVAGANFLATEPPKKIIQEIMMELCL